jgi:serine/threonine protein kinase
MSKSKGPADKYFAVQRLDTFLFVQDVLRPRGFDELAGSAVCELQTSFDAPLFETIDDLPSSGTLGLIKRMKRKSDGQEVAVKFFTRGGSCPNEEVMKRFFRELEGLRAFPHPCIMQMVGFQLPGEGMEGDIATFFMKNGSLADVASRVKAGETVEFWTPTGIAKLVTSLVLGMKFIHSQGALHRNLKPSNLFVTDDGCLQIGDLAFCRFLKSEAQLTAQPGTAHYQAPEIYEEEPYTEKVDVFAFGLILYEILALKPVFPPALPPQKVMKKLISEHFAVIPDDWLPSVKELLNRCWRNNPRSRPTFDEIASYLKDHSFQIGLGVDAHVVQSFVDEVEGED